MKTLTTKFEQALEKAGIDWEFAANEGDGTSYEFSGYSYDVHVYVDEIGEVISLETLNHATGEYANQAERKTVRGAMNYLDRYLN